MPSELLQDVGAEYQAEAERDVEITASFISTGFWTHDSWNHRAKRSSLHVPAALESENRLTPTKPTNKVKPKAQLHLGEASFDMSYFKTS